MYFRAYFILLKEFVAGILFAVYSFSAPLAAFDLGLGVAAVEQGDDSQRPAALLHLGFNDFYAIRGYIYGRDYGPIEERTYSLSMFRRFGILAHKDLEASLGLIIMDEQIAVTYSNSEEEAAAATGKKAISSVENNMNFGAATGVYWKFLRKPVELTLGWEAHLFAAGLQGGLLLSTGRKQYLSLTSGYSW